VVLAFVGIDNISVDQSYLDGLKAKSQAQIQREIQAENAETEREKARLAAELAGQETLRVQAQLETEKAKTDIALEVADRDKKVSAKRNEVWSISPEAYELERIRLMSEAFDDADKIYFIPEGQDITLYLGTPPVR